MLKMFEYRLYPTKRQIRLLSEQLEECRWLWNTLLAERKTAWEERQEALDYYQQKAELPVLKIGGAPCVEGGAFAGLAGYDLAPAQIL
jgi:putative transposase